MTNETHTPRGALLGFALLGIGLTLSARPLAAYSVLSHEALIDAAWHPVIVPLLLSRFPAATPAELAGAHAYAYGGCVIQDLGYYPLGNHFFSNLTHYARTGDFVEALLKDSRNVDEYAFALGALSHYVADNTGHPLAVNLAVPEMYPRLRQEYGTRVTYEDNPRAHIMTEFSFDVVQVTGAGYLPRTYHNFIGFKVPRRLLDRAFNETYGLPPNRVFLWEGLSLKLYEVSASEVVPALGSSIWRHKRKKLARLDPQLVKPRFNYRLAPGNYERPGAAGRGRSLALWRWNWRQTTRRAELALFSRFAATLIEILPKIGSLRTLEFKPPTLQVQKLFVSSFDDTVARFEVDVSELPDRDLNLPEYNLDLGTPLRAGQYRLADDTYARWLHDLARRHFRGASPAVRADIVRFYSNLQAPIASRRNRKRWKQTLADLSRLRSGAAGPQISAPAWP